MLFSHGCRLEQEEKPLECSSRSCKIKSLLSTAAREQLGTTTLVKPGFGGRSGWLLSPTLSALSLESTKRNMKIRLLWQRLTSTKLFLNVMQ